MKSINRKVLLASTTIHNDRDPSPAGGAMPVPAIHRKDGAANDNATPGPLEPAPNSYKALDVHPTLARVLFIATDTVDKDGKVAKPGDSRHRAESLAKGSAPLWIELSEGKVINYSGAIEAEALASIGKDPHDYVKEIGPLSDDAAREHVLRSFPSETMTEIARAIACVLSTTEEERLAFSKSIMSRAGKKGAAIKHASKRGKNTSKGSEKKSAPKSSGYPLWVLRLATLARCKPYTIREVFRYAAKYPDVFDMLRPDAEWPYKLSHLGDANALTGRFNKPEGKYKTAAEVRRDAVRYWRVERGGPEAKVKLTDTFAFMSRRLSGELPIPKIESSRIVRIGDATLYNGRMEDGAMDKIIKPGSVDIINADVEYGCNQLAMVRSLALRAKRDLRVGGYVVLQIGNGDDLPARKLFLEVAGPEFRVAPTIVVHYMGAKGGNAKLAVRHIDAMSYYVFARGREDDSRSHLHFESFAPPGHKPRTNGSRLPLGGEGVHHLWQKSPQVMRDIFETLAPTHRGEIAPLVVDVCMGWGTSGLVCRMLGWRFVGAEPKNDPKEQGGPRFSVACDNVRDYRAAWKRSVAQTVKCKTCGTVHVPNAKPTRKSRNAGK